MCNGWVLVATNKAVVVVVAAVNLVLLASCCYKVTLL